jgi:uncharacterized repeat protein (TIGR02543 family)
MQPLPYALTYAGNGATGGSAPSDGSSPYAYGATVTVLGAGSLTRTGYTFAGWNAAADGSCTSYAQGATFAMPGSPVTLYAQWQINSYAVTYVGTGATSGSVPVDGSNPHTYGGTVIARGSGTLARTGYTFNGWNTAADGSGTSYQPGATFAMPASALTLYAQWKIVPRLRSGTTICKGKYTGSGSQVIVPTGATCTLAPGTHVKHDLTVRPDGLLHVNRVTIGGNLLMSSSATVCGSRVGGDVMATGGSFTLGGPGCAGNTIAGNAIVTNDDRVTVFNNTIGGDLLVASSGPPVEVTDNRAATARCVHNKGQTGSGNVAHGKSTCPR